MLSPIIPLLLTLTTFILILSTILFGQNPSFGQDYAVLSLDMTSFGTSYFGNSSIVPVTGTKATRIGDLGISDWYSMHVLTTCYGSYENGTVACTKPSSYAKFAFLPLLRSSLVAASASLTLPDLSFPLTTQRAIDSAFAVRPNLNLLLHVAFVFWILAAVWTLLGLAFGFCCLCGPGAGALALSVWPFTSAASTCLLIAAALATSVRDQGTTLVNAHSGETGIVATGSDGFVGVAWGAFVISTVSTAAWVAAGAFSALAHFGD